MKSFKNYLLVVTSLVLLFSCTEDNKKKKVVVANEFLHYYLNEVNKNKAPMMLESYSHSDASRCLSQMGDELTKLGFDMEDLIEESSLKFSLQDSAKFISKEQLPNLSAPNSWKKFKNRYKNGFYVISAPIVNDNCDRIIVYYSYYCDERCGNGEVVLYKKNGSGWKRIKKYCDWVS